MNEYFHMAHVPSLGKEVVIRIITTDGVWLTCFFFSWGREIRLIENSYL